MSRITSLAAAALVALAASCGGEEKAATEGCRQGGGGGDAKAVCMKDIKYLPARVTVPAGATVVWTNADPVPHTVTKESGPGPEFDSQTVTAGQTYEQRFPVAGTIEYVCTIHPSQRGAVVVE